MLETWTLLQSACAPSIWIVYIVFAKLNHFSEDEIRLCRHAQRTGAPRVIMLTHTDLEPYEIPQEQSLWAKTPLGRLALGTQNRYFPEQNEVGSE